MCFLLLSFGGMKNVHRYNFYLLLNALVNFKISLWESLWCNINVAVSPAEFAQHELPGKEDTKPKLVSATRAVSHAVKKHTKKVTM